MARIWGHLCVEDITKNEKAKYGASNIFSSESHMLDAWISDEGHVR